MLNEEVKQYRELSGDNNPHTPISRIGGYLDGYEKAMEPKTGHWFIDERPESDREIICSNCEQPIFRYHKLDFDYRPNYCPNCGAKMVEPQESEDGNDYIC